MTGILQWASTSWAPLKYEIVHIWQSTHRLTMCQGLTIFGVTFVLIIGATVVRAWYHLTRKPVHIAEIGIDLAAGALALALTVPLEAACRLWFGTSKSAYIPPTNQFFFWVIVVPLIALAALQANSWLLSVVASPAPKKSAFVDHLPAFAAISLGAFVLIIASGFHAARLGCPS
jgi:hypothetical protein